jgi:glycosyltransferase involved in cell wall biosynthesis
MRIILAADIFPPDIGGPATYSKNLATELIKNGHDVQLICYGDKFNQYEDDGGYKVIKIGRDKPLLLRYFDYFSNLLKVGKKVDLIYSMGPVSAGLPTMLAAKFLRKKYIIKVVGDYAWEQARGRFNVEDGIDEFQSKKYLFKIEIFRKIQRMVSQNAYKIITPSYYLKGIVTGWGAKEDNIKVIYNSVNFDFVNIIDKVEAQEKIRIKGKLVFSIARLVPWKGFEMLINLWREFLEKEPGLKLIIAGSGPEEENLKSLVKKNNLEDKVFLVGKVEHKELSNYFSASDIFVLNSGYEGLSHVLIEAMAHKLPIIASDKGGNVEVIKDNVNGLLAEYNNEEDWKSSILEIVNNYELKNKFTENSLADLDKFKYETMIDNTINFISDVGRV